MSAVYSGASCALRRSFARASAIALLAIVVLLVWAAPALALKITEAKHTGPVAYELKSLQTTHFYCTVDTPGTWATLRIKDGQGRVVRTIYSGPIKDANKRFWFPVWNGLDDAGNRLFSASWNWELTVNKGGSTVTRTGKITVSKIEFFVTGRVGDFDTDFYSRYMIPGNANIYIRTWTKAPFDAFMFGIGGPGGFEFVPADPIIMDSGKKTVNATVYLRGANVVRERGLHVLGASGLDDAYYYMTVIQ